MTILAVAKLLIDSGRVRETEGKNRSELIDSINRMVGIPLGSPYCAAGVSVCAKALISSEICKKLGIDRSIAHLKRQTFPYSGSSQAIMRNFRADARTFTDPNRLNACRGALFGWTNKDGHHGHIGIVSERYTDRNRNVVAIGTYEFNTNPRTKDRDGEGGYHLKREIAELRQTHPNFWFIDLEEVAGGQWWQAEK